MSADEIGVIVLNNIVSFLVAVRAQHCGGHVGKVALVDLVHQGFNIRRGEGSNRILQVREELRNTESIVAAGTDEGMSALRWTTASKD